MSLENIGALLIVIVISKLNHKIPMVFHNIKNYDSHLFMQELYKFDFKIILFTKWIRKIYEL